MEMSNKDELTIFARNLRHLLEARGWNTPDLGKRLAHLDKLDETGATRKVRRLIVDQQSPKWKDLKAIASIFGIDPAILADTDLDEVLKDTSPLADLGTGRGCPAPAGRDASGGTLPGGSGD